MCRVLGVSPSGYYAWRGRGRSLRAKREEALRGTGTTRVDPSHRAVPDRVERQFQADGPDRIWVADITYVPTWTGFVYLAVVLDVFSRRVVGWSMAHHLRTELVLGALNMALGQRRPEGVVHHSDREKTVRPPAVHESGVTPISATGPSSAPRCATPSTTATVAPSPCSASPPPRGSWPLETASSDGRRSCARRISPSWSTTRGSSSCPGSKSPTSVRTSSPSSAVACQQTGPSATTPPPCSSKPSSRPPATPAPSTGHRDGPTPEPPRDADATTGTRDAPNRKRISGSAPSEKIGNEPSTAKLTPHHGPAERLPTGTRLDARGF